MSNVENADVCPGQEPDVAIDASIDGIFRSGTLQRPRPARHAAWPSPPKGNSMISFSKAFRIFLVATGLAIGTLSAKAEDAMKKDSMKSDAMKSDSMKKDSMSKDTMKKDSMQSDSKKDAMKSDPMKKN
jgi:pentapeptide MXKDX repeat protein